MKSKTVSPEVSAYFSAMGKKSAATNLKKGSAYFKALRAKRTQKGKEKYGQPNQSKPSGSENGGESS